MRLIDTPGPRGEISVRDLTALASALQELSTRVGRDVLRTPGPGRTRQFMEEFTELRLRAITAGSTVLTFSRGSADQLDMALPEQQAADRQFWAVLEGIGQDQRPAGISDLSAESAGKFASALRSAAPRAELTGTGWRPVEFRSERIHAETWTSERVRTDKRIEVKGRLEKVDLRSHEFRVQDDVGNTVDLKHVAEDADVAVLVGRWVAAEGTAIIRADRVRALDDVTIRALDDPTQAIANDAAVTTLAELIASAPGPDLGGGIELSDDDFASFLEASCG